MKDLVSVTNSLIISVKSIRSSDNATVPEIFLVREGNGFDDPTCAR